QAQPALLGAGQARERLDCAQRQSVLGLELGVERARQPLVGLEQPDPRVGVGLGPLREAVLTERVATRRLLLVNLRSHSCASNYIRSGGDCRAKMGRTPQDRGVQAAAPLARLVNVACQDESSVRRSGPVRLAPSSSSTSYSTVGGTVLSSTLRTRTVR